jgi:hypothetical protein
LYIARIIQTTISGKYILDYSTMAATKHDFADFLTPEQVTTMNHLEENKEKKAGCWLSAKMQSDKEVEQKGGCKEAMNNAGKGKRDEGKSQNGN